MQIQIIFNDDDGNEMLRMRVSQPDGLKEGIMARLGEYFSSIAPSGEIPPSPTHYPRLDANEALNETSLDFLKRFKDVIKTFKNSKNILNPGLPKHLWEIYHHYLTPEIFAIFNLMMKGELTFVYFKQLNIPNKHVSFLMFYHTTVIHIERKAELLSTTTEEMEMYLRDI